MIKIKGYVFANDGIIGDKWEKAVCRMFNDYGFRTVSFNDGTKARAGAGKPDVKVYKNNTDGYFSVDAKNSASVLAYDGKRLVKGSSLVCYAPIIPDDAIIFNSDYSDFEIDYNKVEFFLVKKSDFVKAIKTSGLYKSVHIATNGDVQIHIATFFSRSQNKVMSAKKYNILVNSLYDVDIFSEVENW